jgi:GNAT superfamily N-acetyltransferase
MPEDRLSEIAELAEAENLFRIQDEAPEEVKTALGMASARIGGGVVLAMRNDPTGGCWNKALGLGFTEPITHALVAEVCDFLRERGSPSAHLQLAPSVLPPDWAEICAANGLTAEDEWVKLVCRTEEFRYGGTELRVGPVDGSRAGEAAAIFLRGFAMPEGALSDLFATVVRLDGFRAFAAWDGDDMVANAYVLLNGEAAELSGAATRPGHRNRGAQTALLGLRADAAAQAGCRWLVAETNRPPEGLVNPSLNNLLRVGFRPLYARRNWLWKP